MRPRYLPRDATAGLTATRRRDAVASSLEPPRAGEPDAARAPGHEDDAPRSDVGAALRAAGEEV